MAIYFYSTTDEYGCFSNFSRHGIAMDDGYWPTVEHYFQEQKFNDPLHRERIRRATTPKEAKRLGWIRTTRARILSPGVSLRVRRRQSSLSRRPATSGKVPMR